MSAAGAELTTVNVTAATFQQQVLSESFRRPVVVDFWADWCGPCKVLGPVLERAAAEDRGKWLLAKVDTEAEQALAQQFRIQSIPAVKAFFQGQIVDEFVGALPPSQIRRWLDGLVPSEADIAAQHGGRAMQTGDMQAAKSAFETALKLDDGHGRARLGMASIAVLKRDFDAAKTHLAAMSPADKDALKAAISELELQINAASVGDVSELAAQVTAAPDDHESRLKLATANAAAGAWEDAFEHWLEVVARGRGTDWRDKGRVAMVEGFNACPDPRISDPWRRKLSMEWFS